MLGISEHVVYSQAPTPRSSSKHRKQEDIESVYDLPTPRSLLAYNSHKSFSNPSLTSPTTHALHHGSNNASNSEEDKLDWEDEEAEEEAEEDIYRETGMLFQRSAIPGLTSRLSLLDIPKERRKNNGVKTEKEIRQMNLRVLDEVTRIMICLDRYSKRPFLERGLMKGREEFNVNMARLRVGEGYTEDPVWGRLMQIELIEGMEMEAMH